MTEKQRLSTYMAAEALAQLWYSCLDIHMVAPDDPRLPRLAEHITTAGDAFAFAFLQWVGESVPVPAADAAAYAERCKSATAAPPSDAPVTRAARRRRSAAPGFIREP